MGARVDESPVVSTMTGGIAKTIKTIMGRVAGMTGVYAWDFRSKMTIVAFHRVNDEQAADGEGGEQQ